MPWPHGAHHPRVGARQNAVAFARAARARPGEDGPAVVADFGPACGTRSALADLADGYTYCVTRRSVAGADAHVRLDHGGLFDQLRRAGAPPPLLGFGLSRPEHVAEAARSGAAGAIGGSAALARLEPHLANPAAATDATGAFV